ncbi:MAG: restriction endonuclease subunit S [Gallionella sp.]|nr:restriction endonuclease subunit S [Gallionella sp.]
MSNVSNLPKGWCCTSLEKIASWGSGGTPSRNIEKYFQGTIPWVKTGELESKYIRETEEHISEEALKNSSAKIFPKGSVGIAMYGATIGKLSIWGIDASTNQACAIGIPTEAINNEFLYYYLLSERQNLIKAGKGGAQPNLSQGIIKEWSIDLPPLPEQHRIVAKIEELFSELDKGIENLKTACSQLKVYRQALLKHAFEGKLTAQWRAERNATSNQPVIPAQAGIQPFNDMDSRLRGNDESLETAAALLKRIQQERAQRYQQQLADWQANGGSKPKAPKPLPPLTAAELAELPELPEGWGHIRIGNLLDVVSGNTPKGIEITKGTEIPYYRVSDMNRAGNEVSMNSSATYLSDKEAADIGLNIFPVGTIIFPKRGGAIATNKKRRLAHRSCFDLNLMGLTNLPNSLSAGYLWLWMLALDLASISDGSNVPQINNRNVEPLAFPICSPDEQALIVELADSRLSVCDQLDKTITTSLQQAEALRQSILKKAFSGQLVPQDPHDEPASALLARIKAERAEVAAKPLKKKSGKETP